MNNSIMKAPLLHLVLATGLLGQVSRSAASIQTSSEVWVGSASPVQGSPSTVGRVSFFSQRMVRPLETAGTVTGVQAAVLTDTNSAWADSQFGPNGVPAYVEFDNGWRADIADCSAANHCLTLAGALGDAASAGNKYRIHKHFTVGSIFGTNNEAGLNPGLNPSAADNILLVDPQTQALSDDHRHRDHSCHDF